MWSGSSSWIEDQRDHRSDWASWEQPLDPTRPVGFYRHGQWVGRQRTDDEQRFHTGGQGIRRQTRRQLRLEQWMKGEFVPTWQKVKEAGEKVNFAELLNRHLRDPAPAPPDGPQGDNDAMPAIPEVAPPEDDGWDAEPPVATTPSWDTITDEQESNCANPVQENGVETTHLRQQPSSAEVREVLENGVETTNIHQQPLRADGATLPHGNRRWGAQEWQDWEDWETNRGGANPETDDSSTFMQLGMSEEAELENLGLHDQARRDLRDLLHNLQVLDQMEEGPEGRWALREWLIRWRHVLGVLQSLTEIVERRLSSSPGCSFPVLRAPGVASQRTRLLGMVGRICRIFIGVAENFIEYHTRRLARLPVGVPLPPPPEAPRPPGVHQQRVQREQRERSRSRSDPRRARGETVEPEPEDDLHSLVQVFSMREWQGLSDEGVGGANISDLDNYIGDLSLRTDDPQRPLHERA